MQIFGRNVVLTALEQEIPLKEVKVAANVKGDSIKKLKKLCAAQNLEIKWIHPHLLDKEAGAGNVHQGVLAYLDNYEYTDLKPFIHHITKEKQEPIIVICDQITDPHNLGAIIRTAECVGADAVIIPDSHSAEVNNTVFKTSAGAAFKLPIIKTENLKETIDFLHSKKFGVFALDGEAESSFTDFHYAHPVAVVIGNEGIGIRNAIRNNCDEHIKIPIYGKTESLNASVSAAVVLYHIVEKRGIK